VITLLNQLAGSTDASLGTTGGTPAMGEGAALLEKNSEVLLGPPPTRRNVRTMVTMPSEAATDNDLVRDLVLHGIDCMRINCAHSANTIGAPSRAASFLPEASPFGSHV